MKLSWMATLKFSLALGFLAGILLFLVSVLFIIPAFSYSFFIGYSEEKSDSLFFNDHELEQLQQKATALERSVNRLSPTRSPFLIINTTENTFRLYRNREIVARGFCSTGSLVHLEVDSLHSWIFETPRGVFNVRNKITDPVWRKPDWAFIEEGLKPPPPGHPSRFEKGVLGDYALDLGNGYFIHGTLYQRLLGRSVTHGCIRLNDNDLKLVYQTMDIGSKVYIY